MSASADASSPTTSSICSPIAQFLYTMGMTREDLTKHTVHMREFLEAHASKPSTSPQSLDHVSKPPPHEHHYASESLCLDKNVLHDHKPHLTHFAHPSPSSSSSPAATSRPHSSTFRFSTTHSSRESTAGKPSIRRKQRHVRTRDRRKACALMSPSRPKPSLDEVMQAQARSRSSNRLPESEDSDDSSEGSLRDVFESRRARDHVPRYRYPHPAKLQAVNNSRYYRQEVASTPPNGNYYRNRDIPPVVGSCLGQDAYNRLDELVSQVPAAPLENLVSQQPAVPSTSAVALSDPKPSYQPLNPTSNDIPSSSPVRHLSPPLSPARRTVNLVSSPGPMSDLPDQSDPDLPYTLPPGPYSDEKPDLSYAALIGQAILASPGHALRLKDIYDYISIVYPFFKRDGCSHSQKWMNAIRQNLTNTPQFFKKDHPSGKLAKGSLWCIADKDLPCFANGGYNRHALDPGSSQSAKAQKRKRKKDEERQRQEALKRNRTVPTIAPGPYHFPYGYTQVHGESYYGQPIQLHGDLFSSDQSLQRPVHLVNDVSQACVEPLGILFPPLPENSITRRVCEQRLQERAKQRKNSPTPTRELSCDDAFATSDEDRNTNMTGPTSSASSSIPDLTPNNSSSSPPPTTDDGDEDVYATDVTEAMSQLSEQEEEAIFNTWVDHEKAGSSEMLYLHQLPLLPTSPTTNRRGATQGGGQSPTMNSFESSGLFSFVSLPTIALPTTPTRSVNRLEGSLTMTPVANRNPPSTPDRNSYQMHASKATTEEDATVAEDKMATNATAQAPSRPTGESSNSNGNNLALPETPRRGFSPHGLCSPYRTPSRRGIFDPADPSTMLDEELTALSRGRQESPVGLFPCMKGFAYESPNLPSPANWRPW